MSSITIMSTTLPKIPESDTILSRHRREQFNEAVTQDNLVSLCYRQRDEENWYKLLDVAAKYAWMHVVQAVISASVNLNLRYNLRGYLATIPSITLTWLQYTYTAISVLEMRTEQHLQMQIQLQAEIDHVGPIVIEQMEIVDPSAEEDDGCCTC